MKGKYASYIYIPILAGALAIGGAAIWNTKEMPNTESPKQVYYLDDYFQADVPKNSEVHAVDEKNVILESSMETIPEETAQFILRAENHYVLVYRTDRPGEAFMSTGICIDELPENTKNEILNGKEILDEEALYFFLESHSS